MWKFLTLISESFRFSINVLINNRLRTILSLLGIAIGIFSIISVYAIVDSLERNIRQSVEGLGNDVVYVQKWPWGAGQGEYPWWKYFQRPEVSLKEYNRLVDRGLDGAEYISFINGVRRTIKFGNSNIENAEIRGVTYQYGLLSSLQIELGRYFSEKENRIGRKVCLLGSELAVGLFGERDPIGRIVNALGRKFTVIGVLPREGSSMLGESHDTKMLIPASLMALIEGSALSGSAIQMKARPDQSLEALKDEVRMNMRAIRRLTPIADDNFSLNESSVISSGLDTMFQAISLAGTFIGGFSILVGGFGIANIMFVSVRERTGQIGIQKALGAKSSFILLQFLVESTLLSILGGITGLFFVAILIYSAASVSGFDLVLSLENIITGLALSAFIGLVSGVAPASMAARLDPVEAIRYNQ